MPDLIGVRVFTASTTYTPTSGTASIVVKCIGGGGGAGGCGASGAGTCCFGSGGGAGALAMAHLTSGFSGVAITIGAGGAGGAAGFNDGSDGGDTSFGSFVIAGGGGHGNHHGVPVTPPSARYGGVGGTASGSAVMFISTGARGRTGYSHATDLSSGGEGASTVFGAGGYQEEHGPIVGGISSVGSGFGSGGGGPASAGSGSGSGAKAGKAGAPGICIIWEWSA